MSVAILRVLDRRLDAAFIEMEIAWALYQQDRKDDARLERYVASLRRSDRLWKTIKRLRK